MLRYFGLFSLKMKENSNYRNHLFNFSGPFEFLKTFPVYLLQLFLAVLVKQREIVLTEI